MTPQEAETMRQLEELVASQPEYGSKTTRAAFKQLGGRGTFNGQSFNLTTNYQVLGPYSQDQEIELLGMYVTVWNKVQSRTVSATVKGTLLETVTKLAREVNELCSHENSTRVASVANCLAHYECQECGHEFQLDSSD